MVMTQFNIGILTLALNENCLTLTECSQLNNFFASSLVLLSFVASYGMQPMQMLLFGTYQDVGRVLDHLFLGNSTAGHSMVTLVPTSACILAEVALVIGTVCCNT